jgi:hypothetical protein
MDEESEPEKPVMAGLSAPAGRDTETFAQQSPEPDISDIERGEPGSMTAGILQPSEVPPSRPLVSEPATESVLNEYPRRRLDQSGEAEQVVATAALVPTVVTSQVPESRDSAQTLEISEIGSSEASVSGVAVKDPIPAEVDLKPGGREIPLELKFLDFGRNFQGWLIRSVPRSVWILFGFLFLFSLPLRSPRKYEA